MREAAHPYPSKLVNQFSRELVFSDAIRSCLETEILPSRTKFPRRFSENDIESNRYHTKRLAIDDHLSSFSESEEQYEQLLQHLFWRGMDADEKNHDPELYITGPVGCGKSTFIDYYIRHYCPEKGVHAEEFDKKLVVYFDARSFQYHAHANQRFFDALKKAVDEHCRSHGIEISINRPTRDSIDRLQESLQLLSELCKTSENFKYLVLVLDNLDNCSVAVQRQVIQYINDIKKYTPIKLFRVIIPLWPTTYDTFSKTTEVLTTGKPRIHLGPPLEKDFIEKRLAVIKDRIIEETCTYVEAHGAPSLTDFDEFLSFVDFVFDSLQSEKIGQLIRDLASGDLRRELWIWEGVLRSAAAEDIFSSAKQTSKRLYDYEWMEALIAGDLRTRNEHDERIANLFTLHHDNASPRDFLAGIHNLHLLSRLPKRRSWYVDMIRLGYREEYLSELETSLRKYNFIHPVPELFCGEDFDVHKKTVDAYLRILSHPAYIDNMAMITPVDLETKKQIKQTAGHISRDFQIRVHSSTSFIEFTRDQEQSFMGVFKTRFGDDKHSLVRELQWLDSVKLPSVSYAMADSYINRLNGLVESGFIEEEKWLLRCVERLMVVKSSFSSEYLL